MSTATEPDLYRTVDARYGRLTLFANDVGAASRSLLKYGEWAQNELDFLRTLIDEGTTVIDVGAYIGTHMLAFSSFVGAAGQVVSIEAQESSFRLLQSNVDTNGLQNVRLEHAAASDRPGRLSIESIDIRQQSSFGSALLRAGSSQARAITLDGLQLADCALIKIDVEGMEDLVLQGADALLQRGTTVYAECNSLEDGLRTLHLLWSRGYGTFAHVVRAFDPDNFNADAENIFEDAAEVALVAATGDSLARLAAYRARPCELLLEVRTADDLALALLNKPQYRHEVLSPSAAASGGALRCFDELERCEERLAQARDREIASTESVNAELERLQSRLAAVHRSNVELADMLGAIRSSTIWRLSAPARRLHAGLRQWAGRLLK